MPDNKATTLFLVLIFGLHTSIYAQNLVPNPGFEEYSKIPLEPGEWDKATSWDNLNGVSPYQWPYGSPDYLRTDAKGDVSLPNSIFGYVYPHSGAAIMGIVSKESSAPEYREYLSTHLIWPLVPGNIYDVKFYVSNSQRASSRNGSDGIGVVFSTHHLMQNEHELVRCKPTWQSDTIIFTQKWTLISFSFVADSAYEYFTIGNFKDDAHTHISKPQLLEQGSETVSDNSVDSLGNESSPEYSLIDHGSAYFFLDDVLVKLSQSANNYPVIPRLQESGMLLGPEGPRLRHTYCFMARALEE